jgi:predicted nucleotide-binding protein (sugar kinase/HSP70/actin superfamily)
MQLLYRTRPYEAQRGAAERLYESFMSAAKTILPHANAARFNKLCQDTIHAFDHLALVNDRSKPRVGVVGEILVKFHPTANNQLVKVIEAEGCEADVPGLVDFFLFGMSNQINMNHELGTKAISRMTHHVGINYVEGVRKPIDRMLRASDRFQPYEDIFELAHKAEQILSLCNTMGEGWLLTAEMVDLIEHGTPNIVCAQPFACLPNHVVGKSVIKRLRQMHPSSNIVAVDYDPGASEVNQLNRIKLMISVAKENFGQKTTPKVKPDNQQGPFALHDSSSKSAMRSFEDELAGLNSSACSSSHGYEVHLSEKQLAEIEQAKVEAGVH